MKQNLADRLADMATDDDYCGHELVDDVERIDGIFHGVCGLCHQPVWQVGLEDEAGEPGWERIEPESSEVAS